MERPKHKDWLVEATRVAPEGALASFVTYFRERYGEELLAVVFYGSRHSGAQAKSGSLYDFFLIAGDYRRFYTSRFHALLNKLAPPNIYHVTLPASSGDGASNMQGALGTKYGVVSLDRLERECSERAHDHYFLGRFAQKIALVWARDEELRARLCATVREATSRAVALAVPYLEPEKSHQPRTVAREFLALSYAGDVRIEGEQKFDAIIAADPAFYDRLYGEALGRASAAVESLVQKRGEGFASALSEARRAELRTKARRFLARARRRALGRWIGHLLTFKDPVNYLLAKYERHVGRPVALTPLQRRWPLIFGWPALFRILKERRREADKQLGE